MQIVAVNIYDYTLSAMTLKNKSGFIVQPKGFNISKCCISPADYDSSGSSSWLNCQKRDYTSLIGAVYHNGKRTCGHYTALVNTGDKEKTFIPIDDDRVARRGTIVTQEEISSPRSRFCKNCYILFYE